MILEGIIVLNDGQKRSYSAAEIIAGLDGTGAGGGGGGTPRLTMTASYQTSSTSPTVFYSALNTDGSTLTPRTTSGVTTAHAAGLYVYTQSTVAITDFIAVWDEGDVNTFTTEWIVVDT